MTNVNVNKTIYSFTRDDGKVFSVTYSFTEDNEYAAYIDRFTRKTIPAGKRHVHVFAVTLADYCITNIFVRIDDDGYIYAWPDHQVMSKAGTEEILGICKGYALQFLA